MNALIISLIKTLAGWVIGKQFFDAIQASVKKWGADHRERMKSAITEEDKLAQGRLTQNKVLLELEDAGYSFTTSAALFGIELAVQLFKRLAK